MEANMSDEHYLKRELYQLVKDDTMIFEFLQSGSLDGIWYWDLQDPEHEWMSPRFWETLGFSPSEKEHLCTEWQDLIHPEDAELVLDNIEKHCNDPSYPYDQIVRYRHNDGSLVWIRCRGIAIRDKEGRPTRMLGAHTDVTELKEAQHKNQHNDALKEVNKELKQFASIVSHDLRAPLRTIGYFVDKLQQVLHTHDPEINSYLEGIAGSTQRAQRLLQDISDYSSIQTKAHHFARTDLQLVLQDVKRDMSSLLEQTNATLDIGPMPTIIGDHSQLSRVFQNLITNGLKYQEHDSQTPPHIVVSATDKQHEGWQFSVKDNGIGIEDMFYDRIFEMFQRLHHEDEYSGTGAGLAICRKIIERHQGRIWVDSTLGEGSTFHFLIPPL